MSGGRSCSTHSTVFVHADTVPLMMFPADAPVIQLHSHSTLLPDPPAARPLIDVSCRLYLPGSEGLLATVSCRPSMSTC